MADQDKKAPARNEDVLEIEDIEVDVVTQDDGAKAQEAAKPTLAVGREDGGAAPDATTGAMPGVGGETKTPPSLDLPDGGFELEADDAPPPPKPAAAPKPATETTIAADAKLGQDDGPKQEPKADMPPEQTPDMSPMAAQQAAAKRLAEEQQAKKQAQAAPAPEPPAATTDKPEMPETPADKPEKRAPAQAGEQEGRQAAQVDPARQEAEEQVRKQQPQAQQQQQAPRQSQRGQAPQQSAGPMGMGPTPTGEARQTFSGGQGFPLAKPGPYSGFVVDLGQGLEYFSGSTIRPLADMRSLGRFTSLVVDFPNSMGMGAISLQGELRYAEMVTRKRLESQGELTLEGQLLLYDAKKTGPNEFEALYQVAPKGRYQGIQNAYTSTPSGFVYYDTVSLLRGLILNMDRRNAHAVAMHVADSLILLIGRGHDFYLARRYQLIGDESESIADTIYAIERDIETVQRNNAVEVDRVEWIEAYRTDQDWKHPATEIPLNIWPLAELNKEGQRVYSALPAVMKRVPASAMLGPKNESWLRPLERVEKILWLALVAGIAICVFTYFSLEELKRPIARDVRELESQIAMLKQQTPDPVDFPPSRIQPTLDMANSINLAAYSPPLVNVWNQLAAVKPASLQVDMVNFNYAPDFVTVIVEGKIHLGLTQAQSVFTEFIASLERSGFQVADQSLYLDVTGNTYTLTVTKPVPQG